MDRSVGSVAVPAVFVVLFKRVIYSPVEEEQSGTTSVTGKVKEASVSLWPAFIYCFISFSFNANDIYGQGVVWHSTGGEGTPEGPHCPAPLAFCTLKFYPQLLFSQLGGGPYFSGFVLFFYHCWRFFLIPYFEIFLLLALGTGEVGGVAHM